MSDSFIAAATPDDSRALLKGSAKEAELKDGQYEEKPFRKRKNTLDAYRYGPKYYQSMKADLENLARKIPLTTKAFKSALAELQCLEEHKQNNDPALQGFFRGSCSSARRSGTRCVTTTQWCFCTKLTFPRMDPFQFQPSIPVMWRLTALPRLKLHSIRPRPQW